MTWKLDIRLDDMKVCYLYELFWEPYGLDVLNFSIGRFGLWFCANAMTHLILCIRLNKGHPYHKAGTSEACQCSVPGLVRLVIRTITAVRKSRKTASRHSNYFCAKSQQLLVCGTKGWVCLERKHGKRDSDKFYWSMQMKWGFHWAFRQFQETSRIIW